jgi:agmatine/peptidylarginine deiminase
MKGLLKTYRSAVIFGTLCAVILLLLSVAVNVETASARPSGKIWTPGEYETVYGVLVRWGPHKDLVIQLISALTEWNDNVIIFIMVKDKDGSKQQLTCSSILEDAGVDMYRIRFIPYTANSNWIADYGPQYFINDGSPAILDYKFHKSVFILDDAFPGFLGSLWQNAVHDIGLIHSGGNFLNTSKGKAFISSLIFDAIDGNPGMTPDEIKELFLDYLNVEVTIYERLPSEVDRVGSIDMWMMPISDNDIVVSEFDWDASGYQETEAAVADLLAKGYNVWRTPARRIGDIHYTYTNAAIVNDKVFIPKYGGFMKDDDKTALDVYKEAMGGKRKKGKKKYKFIQVDCSTAIGFGGAIHAVLKRFSVVNLPFVEVLSPNGGELWQTEQDHQIRWIAHGDPNVTAVDIYYSVDAGQSFPYTIATGAEHIGTYTWTTPPDISENYQVKVFIHGTDPNTAEDTSNANFSIDAVRDTVLLDDDFEQEPDWSDNWSNDGFDWIHDSQIPHRGSYCAATIVDANETFTSIPVDTSDAIAVTVDFWFRKHKTKPGNFDLYYYNGTTYNLAADLEIMGYHDTWLHYRHRIIDSQYFITEFKIRLDPTLDHDDAVWIDDVVITKTIRIEELSVEGDITGDEQVNLYDLLAIAANWTRTDCIYPETCDGADIAPVVGDNNVNIVDLAELSKHWAKGVENDPPDPNPMVWEIGPYATGPHSIEMIALTASDENDVEYYFNNVTISMHDSGWQDSTTYKDTGLDAEAEYAYKVKTRDKSVRFNESDYSASVVATTQGDVTPPEPAVMVWAATPEALGIDSITMEAMPASDPSDVEYYFECIDPNGHDSGWQDLSYYTDTGLEADTKYTYRAKARDKSPSQNETEFSTLKYAVTDQPNTLVDIHSIALEDGRVWGNEETGGIGRASIDSSPKELLLGGTETYGYRTILSFNTSVLPEYCTIIHANLSMTRGDMIVTNPFNWGGTCRIDIVNPFFGTSHLLHDHDWQAPTDANNIARFYGDPGYENIMTSGNFSQEGIDNISKNGYTQFKIYFTNTIHLAGNSWLSFYAGNTFGKEPKLNIMFAKQNDTTPPSPNPMVWASEPTATGPYSIIMTAADALDDSGLEYYFNNITEPSRDSGWQNSPLYEDVSVNPNTTFTYQVKARDKSEYQNETEYSPAITVTTDDGSILYEQSLISSAAYDGRIWGDEAGPYNGNSFNSSDSSGGALCLGDRGMSGFAYAFIVSFNTSPLPDNCTIVSAKLEVTRGVKQNESGQDPFSWGGLCYIDLDVPSFGAAALAASDWNATPTTSHAASFPGPDPGPDNKMLSTSLTPEALSSIITGPGGRAQLRARFTNICIVDYNYLGFYAGDHTAEPDYQPKLIVQYTLD